ncbi:3-oxoacyl-[acyl-carrier-protein] synthase 2 [Clostridium zeae]|uniref:3-oxoacyl-[acyl-carrier-protein] synthase 2 n=1 Tax=Clostridium zeae TaxID=2759022 RepID=A0ABQ1E8N7_9CLOT|nr:beta-ketoacyl-[acyl-carrier-protein] synthase family protein [Clostridium zeae]GFZ30873.1 3-oxoacyl-[acyl-carrier-protein] synthase 2 [Clostridium zeae]
MERRRIVVTGIGIETSIGANIKEFTSSLMQGISGVDKINIFDAQSYRTNKAAYIKKVTCKDNTRGRIFAILDNICDQAVRDSALSVSGADIGVSIGSCLGNVDCLDKYYDELVHENDISPLTIMDQPHIHAASYIAQKYNFYNIASVSDTACSSAANAIGFAIERIRSGKAEVMLTGGVDPFSRLSQGGFGALKNLTTSTNRPLSDDCDGIVLGEGGGVMIFEELQHALRRNAKIYCEIGGYGIGNDAYHETKPDPKSGGAIRALTDCLQDSSIDICDVDYINAHGTGTRLNDSMELNAISKVFGKYAKQIPVSTIKPMVGHTLGASGAIELIACIISIQNKFIPPTINHLKSMKAFEDIDVIPNKARIVKKLNVALSSSFAFGGNMAVISCKKYNS